MPATTNKIFEENIREGAALSRALWLLMAGVIEKSYPHAIGKEELIAIFHLATEIQARTEAAERQFYEEAARS